MRPQEALQAEGRIDVRLCVLARASALFYLVEVGETPLDEAFNKIADAIAEIIRRKETALPRRKAAA